MAARSSAVVKQVDDLHLYSYVGCPFCEVVESTLKRLGVVIEKRDIRAEPRFMAELRAATGSTTVPVLRVSTAHGDEWLTESKDIILYLKKRFT